LPFWWGRRPHLVSLSHAPPKPRPTPPSRLPASRWAITPIRKVTGPLSGKDANVRAALQGLPSLPSVPAGDTAPFPTSGARRAHSGNSRGQPAGQGPRGQGPVRVPGGRGLRLSGLRCPGGGPRSPRAPVPSLGYSDLLPAFSPLPFPPPPSCLRWETGPSLRALVSRKVLTCRC
jgi:hypothetical protein